MRKAQSEIITTVLIILLVIAAVIIVWQAVKPAVEKGTEGIEGATTCMNLQFSIVSASAGTDTVKVTRLAGGADDVVTGLKVLIGGTSYTPTTNPAIKQLETQDYSGGLTIATGNKVEIAPILKDNTLCPVAATATAVA